jgi:hypothetical protein
MLGAAALGAVLVGLVISIERMPWSPQQLMGSDERDDWLTASVRAQLREQLSGAMGEADATITAADRVIRPNTALSGKQSH